MRSKPNNWNEIAASDGGDFPTIQPGGYVCIIRKVTDVPMNPQTQKGDYLSIEFDICEGELKGFAVDNYERWGKWPMSCTMVRSYKDSAINMFKAFIEAVEQTNSGFQFDWNNPQCLVNRGIGVIFGEEEYLSRKDNTIKTTIKPRSVTTAGKVRNNDYKMPKLKEFKGEIPEQNVAAAAGFEAVPSSVADDDLPF